MVPKTKPEPGSSSHYKSHLISIFLASCGSTLASFPFGTVRLLGESMVLLNVGHEAGLVRYTLPQHELLNSSWSIVTTHLQGAASSSSSSSNSSSSSIVNGSKSNSNNSGTIRSFGSSVVLEHSTKRKPISYSAAPSYWMGIDQVYRHHFNALSSPSPSSPSSPSYNYTSLTTWKRFIGLLYRGVSVELLTCFPAVLSKLAVFQLLWQRSNTRVDFKKRTTFACFFHGALGGVAETFFTNTTQLIRTRRLMQPTREHLHNWDLLNLSSQSNTTALKRTLTESTSRSALFRPPAVTAYENGTLKCIECILKNEPKYTLLTSGFQASLLSNALYNGMFFTIFKKSHEYVSKHYPQSFKEHSLVTWTSLAGFSAAVASFPLFSIHKFKTFCHASTTLKFDKDVIQSPQSWFRSLRDWLTADSYTLGRAPRIMQNTVSTATFVLLYGSILSLFQEK